MKTRLAITSLLLAFASLSFALEVDITNDPNLDLLVGYRITYQDENQNVICQLRYWESPNGRIYLKSTDGCNSIGSEQAYNDAVRHSKAKIHLRCLDTHSGTYVFLDAEAHNRPGWFYLDKLRNGGRLSTGIVGYWQEASDGNLMVDFGTNAINVNMSNVYSC